MDGERLRVETSEAYAISLTGSGDRWQSGQERHSADGEPISEWRMIGDGSTVRFGGATLRVMKAGLLAA